MPGIPPPTPTQDSNRRHCSNSCTRKRWNHLTSSNRHTSALTRNAKTREQFIGLRSTDQTCVKSESQSISFYGKGYQEDIIYDFLQAKTHIFDWKALILCSENQDLAKQDVLRSLDATSALIIMDLAMKSQCQTFREKQSD